MRSINKKIRLLAILPFLAFIACSPKFVKQDQVSELEKKYTGVYILKKNVEVGINEILKKGTKVRLYIVSGRKLVKVYAYPAKDNRESTLGQNILLLFETQFPEKKFNQEIFIKKLNEIVKKAK
ncbi:MAG: type II secretion system-associated lipoprotein [Leptospirales bacterium]